MTRLTLAAIVAGAALLGLALAGYYGATFTYGGRCARAFPNDGLAQERCIWDLEHGRRL